ncbi:molybdopterin-dependent oxidoreductase [Mycolicibacter arupensis]|jgi:anaerobic selenocysteine-containing dehydrogenase|uniref:molybdopterin-dependent oxidoreductase n=1 Tax=Mycolicibacter arupensis TaxID=342002 RepID=UPI00122C6C24|nr:molybdopterin-dependent oxidoreductase [Mycolicibacter arupensis]KAA1431365.1 molybdopterin-dependent oxidoreductase [Mycolicibacter arupensis]
MTTVDLPLSGPRGSQAHGTSTTHAGQCTLCEAHCGIQITVTDGKVSRIEGNPDDVFSHGYICPKSTAMGGLHEDPDRLRTPMRRVGDGFEPVGWEEAFTDIGNRLRRIRKEHGKQAVGMYLGNPAAHSSAAIYGLLLRAALMTPNFFSASSIDQMPHEFAAWKVFGSNVLIPITDIDRTQRLVILGANPAVSNGSLSVMPGAKRRIKAVRQRGGTVVVIDPRRTETAKLADTHIAVRPGGDLFLLLGMLHVLINENLCDTAALAHQAVGLPQLRRLVADASPEAVAERAGVDAETIYALARDHAAAESAALYCRIGICHQETGTLVSWLVMVINAVTGNLDRAGGTMFSTPAADVPRVAKYIPAGYGAWTDRSGHHKSFRGELPAVVMADEILNPGEGQIKAMITCAGNPVSSIPQKGRLDQAMASLDLYVAIDMYVTETSRHADYILPPASPLEREDVGLLLPVFSVRNNIRYQHRTFEPAAGVKDDWEILSRLMLELLPAPLRAVLAPVRKPLIAAASPLRMAAVSMATGPYGWIRKGRKGITLRKLRDSAGGLDLGPLQPRLREVIGTKDRKAQLAPEEFIAAAAALLAGPASPPTGYDLQLIGRRQLRSNNSWLHNVPSMTSGSNQCTLHMHSDDAKLRGLTEGDMVEVTSDIGKIAVPLHISDDMRPGTVSVPHGWGHRNTGWRHADSLPGANVNDLHDPQRVDTFTGTAAVNNTWVSVAATSAEAVADSPL